MDFTLLVMLPVNSRLSVNCGEVKNYGEIFDCMKVSGPNPCAVQTSNLHAFLLPTHMICKGSSHLPVGHFLKSNDHWHPPRDCTADSLSIIYSWIQMKLFTSEWHFPSYIHRLSLGNCETWRVRWEQHSPVMKFNGHKLQTVSLLEQYLQGRKTG